VAGPIDELERGVNTRLLKGFQENLALAERHQRILVAVHDEGGRSILCDVGPSLFAAENAGTVGTPN